jgi:hypothetical protein
MRRPEWSARWLAVYVLGWAVVVLAAVPAYLALDRPWRLAATRAVCGVIVIVAGVRLLRRVRRAIGIRPVSPLDAPAPPAPPPAVDGRFERLRDDVTASVRSRRYFDAILWPRLLELSGGPLPRPPARPVLRRRGPPLEAIERLIARIEDQP